MLRWLMTVVVSDEEKAHVMRQVGIGKASVSAGSCWSPGEPLRKRQNNQDDIRTGEFKSLRDEPGGCRWLARRCPACRRREPGDLRTESWPRGSGKPTSAVSCPIHVPGLRACRP